MKYIDANKLIAEIKIIQQSFESRDVRFNQVKKIRTECSIELCKCIIDVITSLQQEQSEVDLKEEIIIPRWFLENIEDTLRTQYNINFDKKEETCQDRNIKGALNGVRKLLYGKELTGMERSEKLISYPLEVKEVDLEEEIKNFTEDLFHKTFDEDKSQDDFWNDVATVIEYTAKHFFELGFEAEQKGE